MLCQCGARTPDNVEYCPYCGKRHTIGTRPDQLTTKHVEPYKGDYAEGPKFGACGTLVITLAGLLVLAALAVHFWPVVMG